MINYENVGYNYFHSFLRAFELPLRIEGTMNSGTASIQLVLKYDYFSFIQRFLHGFKLLEPP